MLRKSFQLIGLWKVDKVLSEQKIMPQFNECLHYSRSCAEPLLCTTSLNPHSSTMNQAH